MSNFNITLNRVVGGTLMYALTQLRIKKKYGITDERQALFERAKYW
jgi:hypothetical protein